MRPGFAQFARMHGRLVVVDLLLLAAIGGTVAAAVAAGHAGRRSLARPAVVRGRAMEEAPAVWERLGVRGRVLVHFARRIAMTDDAAPLSSGNYLLRAIDRGVVRRVVHVIPDGAWSEVESTLAARPDVERDAAGFRIENAGVPIEVIRRTDVPDVGEPVLVTIDGDAWSKDALADIVTLVRSRLRADVVVWTAGLPDRASVLEGLRAAP